MPTDLLLLLAYLVVGTGIAWWLLRAQRAQRRGGTRLARATAPALKMPAAPTQAQREPIAFQIDWANAMPHVKLEELLKISGQLHDSTPFWYVFKPTADRRLQLVAFTVGGIFEKTPAGQRSLIEIAGGQRCAWYRDAAAAAPVYYRLSEAGAEEPADAGGEPVLEVSSSQSLIEGNFMKLACHAAYATWDFIKPWDVPLGHAETAALAGVANVSELAQEVESARDFQARHGLAGAPAPLSGGVFYVVGTVHGKQLRFEYRQPVALRMLDKSDLEKGVSWDFQSICQQWSKSPLLHARIRRRKPGEPGADHDLLLLYFNQDFSRELLVNLEQNNALMQSTRRGGVSLELAHVAIEKPAGGPADARMVTIDSLFDSEELGFVVWCAGGELPAERTERWTIPGYSLLGIIAQGAYGQVWLGKEDALQQYRAVKLIRRELFERDEPFLREFNGIRKFEPISREHPGLVDILHVGKSPDERSFYYIMELADDLNHGTQLKPESYLPRTLRQELSRRGGSLPSADCLHLFMQLADALAYLHGRGLVHRDIKPSNIIYVGGKPKLADIGLVAGVSDAKSYVGTEGYIPPEGPGSAQADLYSLGITIGECAFGSRTLPGDSGTTPRDPDSALEAEQLKDVRGLIERVCRPRPEERPSSAEVLLGELRALAKRWAETPTRRA